MLIIQIFDAAFEIYNWILIGRFLLSWLPDVDYYHPVVRFIHKITDPVVNLFKGIIPPYKNVDFSPIILFLVLRLLYPILRVLLVQLLSLFLF